MSKLIKYVIVVLVLVLLIYFSFDIQNLEEYKAKNTQEKFDASEFANRFWEDELSEVVETAPKLELVVRQLELDPELAFEKYAQKLGISKTHYFILNGSGVIESVDEEFLLVKVDENIKVEVATDFIFGNAVRDGSGKVDINQFVNMTDFNNVSVALNKLAKEKVVSRLIKSAKIGMTIKFTGAAEINEEDIDLTTIRVIPVSAKLTDG